MRKDLITLKKTRRDYTDQTCMVVGGVSLIMTLIYLLITRS